MQKVKIFLAVAALVAMCLPALAQPKDPGGEEPGASAQPPDPSAPVQGSTKSSTAFFTKRAAGQWFASDYIGSPVYDANGEEVGEVDELVVDQNGTVVAVIIGVGGFLAVGDKDIAVPLVAARLVDREGNPRVVTDYTRADLERAPAFSRDTD